MEHSQLAVVATPVRWVDYHCLILEGDHFERVSEFSDEETEKQAKQSYKHEVHLLDPNNHFVVPVIDIPDWEKAAVPQGEEARRRCLLGTEVVGTDAAAAVRRVVGTVEGIDHMAVAAGEGFVHNP